MVNNLEAAKRGVQIHLELVLGFVVSVNVPAPHVAGLEGDNLICTFYVFNFTPLLDGLLLSLIF